MNAFKTVLAAAVLFGSAQVAAQTVVKADGLWHATVGAGLSIAGGNTSSKLFNLTGDAVKATAIDKWTVGGSMVFGKTGDTTTADLMNLGARYTQDLNTQLFWFGQGDLMRNKLANLSMRAGVAGGVGYHVIKTEPLLFDVFVGLGYSADSYINSTVVADRSRSSYSRLEMLLGEESIHKLTPTTNFKQRLVIYPNLTDTGEYRAAFDAGLSVSMSSAMSLTATLGMRYNSDPGTALKKTDTLLFTGINYKLN